MPKKIDALLKYKKKSKGESRAKAQMKNKMHHLVSILGKLESREPFTVQALMNQLECSERAVHRYLHDLREVFPINFDREKKSYAFGEGFSLRRPDMTLEEAIALAMAKKVLGNMGPEMEKSLASIEQKLSTRKRELPKHVILSGERPSPSISAFLGTLYSAIINFQRVQMRYKALYSDELSNRAVEPCYLFVQENLWHLRAYCCEKEELRTFAVDRIQSLKILDEYFVPKIEGSSEEDFEGTFGDVVDGDPVEVVLIFDSGTKPYVLRKKWHANQQEKVLKDGRLELRFTVNGLEGIRPWIYRWLSYVEVVAPKDLKMIMKEELESALKRLGSGKRRT